MTRPSSPLSTPVPSPGKPPSGEWPVVPPAPVLIKPPESPLLSTVIGSAPAPLPVAAASTPTGSSTETGAARRADGGTLDYEVTDDLDKGRPTDEPPTASIPTRTPPAQPGRRPATPIAPEESPLLQLQRTVRRQQALSRNPREDLVWQPRFAYTSALVILLALTVVSLPLWIVLYRITDPATNNGAGPRVADLMALCMMLLGGFLTSAAAWVIIIEMRGRVRMVDTLAKTGEREAMATPEIPVLDAPLESYSATPPLWEGPTPTTLAARAEAQQVSAAATLEASSKLLSAFGSVLKSFGQLWAQVAMLAVALSLFVGATVLSLR